jgi:LmbE family N-acetylglucosaminyl deacetylase/ActR/RegA family two-component response regulator
VTDSTAPAQGRILVVEDDPVSALFVTRVLTRSGSFEVFHTPDPVEALGMVASQPWDLVLTDVEMPGMTGIQLLEALRKTSPDLPVAVMTAYASVDYAVRALRNHADEFLEKPIKPDRLVATAAALIAKGRAARLAHHSVVLAIGAHPDDVEIGVGGTLLAHLGRGDSVSILTLCRGARGGSQDTRAAESQHAAEILGATLYLDDLQDTRISESDPTIGTIAAIVDKVEPTVIYTHSLHDVHQDHRNTHRAVMVAARGVGRVYCYQSPSATVDFRPSRFVAIDEHIERKLTAIGAFGSQVEIRAYLEPDLISSTARYWSRFGDGRYAEAFEVIREAADVAGRPPVIARAESSPGLTARPADNGRAADPTRSPAGQTSEVPHAAT